MAGEYMTPPLLTQGGGSNVPQLQYQIENASILPQSGTLPPVSCAPCIAESDAGQSLFWLAVVAGGLVLLTVRKRKPKGEGQTTYGF